MKAMLSNKLKGQLTKVFWITVCWTLLTMLQYLSHRGVLTAVQCDLSRFDLLVHLKGYFFTGIVAGLIGGSVLVFLWENWLRSKKYSWSLLSMFLSYSAVYVVVSALTGAFYRLIMTDQTLLESELWYIVAHRLVVNFEFQNYLHWLLIILGTLIVLLVNDKYGPGAFRAFLSGKYFHPKREERIFMFLDLRSSTTIAEKLGDERYFSFINDVFKFATPAIIYARGEIYQYVGDEIIISWKTESGTENANCLNCFFEIQKALAQKKSYFENRYQVQPEFKAGLHYGHVMAGEVGVVKRDIAYSGDVLNTTSRIQSKCNELGVNILFSQFLLDRLQLPAEAYQPKQIGKMELRGKQDKVMLFTV